MPEQFLVQPYEIATAVKQDNCYLLRWRVQAKRVNVYIGASANEIQRSHPIIRISHQQEAMVPGLETAVRPYFELEFVGGEYDQRRVLVTERFLPYTGVLNFRDVGGYLTKDGHQVKWGAIYRSGLLNTANPTNQAALSQLGIRFIADIRSKDEMHRLPDLPEMKELHHHEWPIESVERLARLQAVWTLLFRRYQLSHWMQHGYTQTIIEENAHVIGDLFQHLADESNLPAVVHCMAGKDRTGVAMALLLCVLGVPEDVVIADYTLSNHYYVQFQQMLLPQIRPFLRLGIKMEELWPLFIADSHRLRNTLQHIYEKYQSIETYLEKRANVDLATITQLRQHLRTDLTGF